MVGFGTNIQTELTTGPRSNPHGFYTLGDQILKTEIQDTTAESRIECTCSVNGECEVLSP